VAAYDVGFESDNVRGKCVFDEHKDGRELRGSSANRKIDGFSTPGSSSPCPLDT